MGTEQCPEVGNIGGGGGFTTSKLDGQQEEMVIRTQKELCGKGIVMGSGLMSRIRSVHGDPTGEGGGK